VIPCRPGSDGSVKMESDLSSETVTWTDSAGNDLDGQGRFKVDAEKRLVLNGARVSDAGMHVCKVSKTTSGDSLTVIRHIVNLNGIPTY